MQGDLAAEMRKASMLAVCLAATVFTRSSAGAREEDSEHTVAGLAVLGGRRAVELRTSGETDYAPFTRGAALTLSGLAVADPRLAAEAARLCRLSAGAPVTSVHAAGLTHLYLGEWDQAIDALSRVSQSSPRYALDVAAAYSMRGLSNGSLTDFARALETLNVAGNQPAAVFNRALVMEHLRDRDAAAEQWKAYLRLDETSRWAGEARRHLTALEKNPAASRQSARAALAKAAAEADLVSVRSIAEVFPGEVRKLFERELLPQWGAAVLEGDATAAARHLAFARSVAAVLRQRGGDRLSADAVQEIESAPSAVPLAGAYMALPESWRAIDAMDYPKALAIAERALARCPDDGAARALLLVPAATARYYIYDYAGTDRVAEKAMTRYADREDAYVSLFAHLAALRGLVATVRGDVNDGLRWFERSLAGFDRLGEEQSQAQQHTNLADTLEYLGDSENAAVHRYRALVIAEGLDNPRRLHPILSEAAEATLAAGFRTAALLYQDRLVQLVEQSRNPLQIADALITRSTILRMRGQRAAALRDLDEANRYAAQIKHAASRERMQAVAAAAEAFAYREADDQRAIDSLSRAIEFSHKVELRMPLAQLLLERGRARNRLGDAAGAETDFRSGIAELEEQRRRVGQAQLRISYYDRAERLFADLALSYLQRGATVDAFNMIERSRARELLDSTTGKPVQPLSAQEIQKRLPGGTTVVTYALTRRGVLVSVIGASALRVFETVVSTEEIESHVDAVSRAFEAEEDLPAADLRWLSEQLIRPLGLAEDGGRVVFIPDQFLHGAPFAALAFGRGSYLIEDHVVGIAPSATMFVRDLERDCSMALHPRRAILSVGSAERPAGFERLEALVHAPEEAARIAALYPERRVLLGSDPKARGFLDAGRDYGVIHFAGHSIADTRNPAASMLLIGEHGRVPAHEIEAARLPHCRVVVLGACSTAMGKMPGGEGAMSLARAFLAASVPSVVATVARVGDVAGEELLTAFHTAYAQGNDAAAALRAAQLQMIHRQGSMNADPTHWAAFEVIGGPCGGATQER
jgi:CHAT domain-containing protein/tetratricopeptide (TPR) repeat protein